MSFKEAVRNVMNGNKYTKEEASAIVAAASRSPKARRKNSNLKRVK